MIKTLEELEQKFYEVQDDLEALEDLMDEFISSVPEIDADAESIKQRRKELSDVITELKLKEREQSDGDDRYALDYPYEEFEMEMQCISTLNTDGLSYPEFLRDVIIPTFHPLPYPEIQNPIMAVVCLINSCAVPPKSKKNAKEVPLSPVYIQGASGTGKSQLTHLISRHYDHKRCVSVSGSNTGGDLIQKMTDACYRSGSMQEGNLKLYPSVIFMENFYNRDLTRWGNFNVQLLATERSFATTARQGKDAKTFYTFLLKVFTSVQPLQAITEQNVELLRRTVRIFTEEFVPSDSVAKYDWSYCQDSYLDLWHPQYVKDKFFPILKQVISKGDGDTVIPSNRYLPSQLIIATGVYLGIWHSLEEAEEHMAEYWKLVKKLENKTGKPYLEQFETSLKGYWQEFKVLVKTGYNEQKADEIASQSYLSADSVLETALEKYGKFYRKDEMSVALQHFMQSKGFKHTTLKGSGVAVFKRF